ncbi:hypothetical protein EP073_09865 [Geovibrio thiophilus]|uniref:Uncharacterized protein n=1 Tax=Geovibrio thiophilus TaxID=139438 RepID=A0A3R5Z008_9BACT|nr:hypothetical protein [Geovibrio thiophilus]QAR33696.1 hypothetical protein EP073_09865 [Geovibrio thiophilus]
MQDKPAKTKVTKDNTSNVKITYRDSSGNYAEHFPQIVTEMLNKGTLNPVELDNETWEEYVNSVNEMRTERFGKN